MYQTTLTVGKNFENSGEYQAIVDNKSSNYQQKFKNNNNVNKNEDYDV